MWKFVQWSLATFVAVALLAVIVGQILATTTGRARDASVAVLKAKLATLEAERAATKFATTADLNAAVEPATEAEVAPVLAALRARWLVLLKEAEDEINACALAPAVLSEIRKRAIDPENWSLEREEMKQVSAYQACLGEFIRNTLSLCDDTARYAESRGRIPHSHKDELDAAFQFAAGMLETYAQVQTAAQEHQDAMNALSGLFNMTAFYDDYNISDDEYVFWIWAAVGDALESGTVGDEQWDTLLRQLAKQRDPERFSMEAERDSAAVLYQYENFSETLADIRISKYPIGYARNWAYKNVTTPLFNHDVEVFGRATSTLLDLTGLPYFEAKPALEQFYEDFDVEPSPNEIKFVRGNSAWIHVLELSRDGFKSEARRQASVDIARIAIVLDRHQRNTGAYPETLNALTEAMGSAALVNPLDGKPYFYERSGDKFWLGYTDPTFDELEESTGARSDDIVYWGIPYGGFGVLLTDGTFLKPFVRGE